MMEPEALRDLIVEALDDLKALDIRILDVRGKTAITDFMVVASGTSDRHVKALSNSVLKSLKEHGIKPAGIEGETESEWILVDARDVVVHVMLPKVRDFYNLEKLWDVDAEVPEDVLPARGRH